METRLIDVLITHAMNWVNCECAFRILCGGLNGLTKRMTVLEAEINQLGLIIDESDIKALITTAKKARPLKVKEHDELFAAWQSANSIREDHHRRYQTCVSFCAKHFGTGYTMHLVLFNAILLGMDPTHAEPIQRQGTPLAATLIRNIPRKAWSSTRWAIPEKPDMPCLRQVTPDRRLNFINTVLYPDSVLRDKLQYDYDSPDLAAIVSPQKPIRKRKASRAKRKSS